MSLLLKNNMIFTNFMDAVEFFTGKGYLVVFLGMIIEGPLVTAVASFLASLGFFNVFVIFIMSIFGDIIGDFLQYEIGKFGGGRLVEKNYRKAGIKTKTFNKIKDNLKKHLGKTLTIIKFTPIFTTPGLMLLGSLKIPLRKFLFLSTLIAFPKNLFFVVVGFYFGVLFERIMGYFEVGQYIIIVFVVLILLSYFIFKKVSLKLASRIEKY